VNNIIQKLIKELRYFNEQNYVIEYLIKWFCSVNVMTVLVSGMSVPQFKDESS
jgi:hypothetical protein